MKLYNIGDSCICFQLDDKISTEISNKIINATREIEKELGHLIHDVVPSYTSIALYFDTGIWTIKDRIKIDSILIQAKKIIKNSSKLAPIDTKLYTLPVTYNGEDLVESATYLDMAPEELISKHSENEYRVAMIGFRPHFPYLMGLDSSIAIPRRKVPRTHIKKGAVGIGGEQAGVYPCDGPGGWNIIGYTDPELLIKLLPGDRVKFKEVSCSK